MQISRQESPAAPVPAAAGQPTPVQPSLHEDSWQAHPTGKDLMAKNIALCSLILNKRTRAGFREPEPHKDRNRKVQLHPAQQPRKLIYLEIYLAIA
jgi:hypothetical protein